MYLTEPPESQHNKGNKEAEEEANKEAEKQIKQINEAGKKNKETVNKNLLRAVFNVNPTPPN